MNKEFLQMKTVSRQLGRLQIPDYDKEKQKGRVDTSTMGLENVYTD